MKLTHEVAGRTAGRRLSWCTSLRDGTVWLREDGTGLAPVGIDPEGHLVVAVQAWSDLGLHVPEGETTPKIRIT